ncbi:aminopeptidase P family protein [Pseudoxanthobacter sp.]|uniref:aminopeptidase P family protein n=1 Tax=Pseudoxanthobacter sp. TaxID=1925742 RepID=UPI002FDFD747
MFQSFDIVSDPGLGAGRLSLLRARLKADGIDGFLVPRSDEHQGEYVPPCAERLAWLTGFTGSAGMAVVLAGEAAVFVDGRYTLQVRQQVDPAAFEMLHLIEQPPAGWLAARLKPGLRIGYDAMLLTVAQVRRFAAVCEAHGATFVAVDANPLDAVWTDRPDVPVGTVDLQPLSLAGESAAAKIARVEAIVAAAGAQATVLTQPDSIAWLFNIRGHDVAHNPVPLSFAIVPAGSRPQLFIDGRKLSNTVRTAIEEVAAVAEPAAFRPALAALGRAGAGVLIDPDWAAEAIRQALVAGGAKVIEGRDPVLLPKAIKNAAEVAGTRTAHLRDGAAVVRFLAWLDRTAPEGTLDEITAVEKLEAFRAATGLLKDISFDTISGSGPNGAIVHYHVSRASNRVMAPGELFLIDSGAQYQDGTTDITRTVPVGVPDAEMRTNYTRVLAGHVALAMARFPAGTSGAQLDPLARLPLWEAGLDFDHGTGHGVGCYLSVHEGPQRIARIGTTPLEPGMIVSDEPGYYKTGAYGIRIENLLLVTPPEVPRGGERAMMAFETLTMVPYDRRLIDPTLLTPAARAWVDAYHAEVRGALAPLLAPDDLAWLLQATAPLAG